MIFESHAHYDDKAFDEDREALLEGLKENGIGYVINIGANIETTRNTIGLAEKYPFIYGAVGVHPSDTDELDEKNFAWLKKQCAHPKIVAVGEIGLDYYWDEPDKKIQKLWFKRQLDMARETKLPVIIHSRDAAKDTLDIMKAANAGEMGGVIHCFSYTKEIAREYLDRNYYFGIGGVITFPNAKKLVEAVKYIPMNRILLETDCPYLAPEPYRGWRNQSSYISLAAERLAEIKEMTKEEVLRQTLQNAKDFYRIP